MRCVLAMIVLLTTTPVLAAEMKVQRNIAYTDPADAQRRLDVYSPTVGDNDPIVVWIHGGGWRRGDKAAVQRKPEAFVEKGYVFVSVNYRFVPDVNVNEMTSDIAKAIKYVHDHAAEYGVAPDTMFVMGHSAGAHLAALVCTDDRYLKAEGLSLTKIKGCVPVDTAAFDVPSQVKNVGPLRTSTYTSVFGADEKSQRTLSPMSYVAKGKEIPPFLILHVADRPDSTKQSNDFAKALQEADVDATVVAAEGKDHGSINRDLGLSGDKPTIAIFEFLERAGTRR